MARDINENIIEMMKNISESLSRCTAYMDDADACDSCRILWSKFRKQREKEIAMLLEEVKKHIDAGKISYEALSAVPSPAQPEAK